MSLLKSYILLKFKFRFSDAFLILFVDVFFHYLNIPRINLRLQTPTAFLLQLHLRLYLTIPLHSEAVIFIYSSIFPSSKILLFSLRSSLQTSFRLFTWKLRLPFSSLLSVVYFTFVHITLFRFRATR